MGDFVDRLEKKLNGDHDKGLWIFFLVGSFALGFATPLVAFDLDSSPGGLVSLIVGIGSMVFIPLGIVSLLAAIYEVQADAQEFVEAYKMDYPKEPEINLIESGYKKAYEYQNKAFKDALTAWLGLGVYIGILELTLLIGSLAIKNWSYFWVLLGICSLSSFVGFILTIISYLRKRSIEKALFAIQLKKSDKAEISIKI